jgi:hypothetical protein
MSNTSPWDPEDDGADWNYTGYGTGDPNANGFLDKLGRKMPWIVGGIMTAGTLQSAGLLGGAGGGGAATGLNADGTIAATSGAPAGLTVGAGAGGGAGAAGAGGGMGATAALGKYGIPAVGDFLTSAFSSSKNSAEAQKQRDFLAAQAALDRQQKAALQNQQTALQESTLDPWRGTMSQVGDASRLDRLANANYTPVSVSRGPGGRVNMAGGTTYNKSPELIAAAKAAAALVLSGGGRVPTMTDPANYGKTGTVDLSGNGLVSNASRDLTPNAAPGTPDTFNYVGTSQTASADPRLRMPAQYLGAADDPWNVAA